MAESEEKEGGGAFPMFFVAFCLFVFDCFYHIAMIVDPMLHYPSISFCGRMM